MPEPEDLAERPRDDEELKHDPELSPTLSGHGENCSPIPDWQSFDLDSETVPQSERLSPGLRELEVIEEK